MKRRLLYTLALPAAAALVWFNFAAAQVQSPAQEGAQKAEAKALLEKAKAAEEAKRLELLKLAELEKALQLDVEVKLKLSQYQPQPGQPPAPVIQAPPAGP